MSEPIFDPENEFVLQKEFADYMQRRFNRMTADMPKLVVITVTPGNVDQHFKKLIEQKTVSTPKPASQSTS